jgi:hypothetical protein
MAQERLIRFIGAFLDSGDFVGVHRYGLVVLPGTARWILLPRSLQH